VWLRRKLKKVIKKFVSMEDGNFNPSEPKSDMDWYMKGWNACVDEHMNQMEEIMIEEKKKVDSFISMHVNMN